MPTCMLDARVSRARARNIHVARICTTVWMRPSHDMRASDIHVARICPGCCVNACRGTDARVPKTRRRIMRYRCPRPEDARGQHPCRMRPTWWTDEGNMVHCLAPHGGWPGASWMIDAPDMHVRLARRRDARAHAPTWMHATSMSDAPDVHVRCPRHACWTPTTCVMDARVMHDRMLRTRDGCAQELGRGRANGWTDGRMHRVASPGHS
jgi:hypothetical protein